MSIFTRLFRRRPDPELEALREAADHWYNQYSMAADKLVDLERMLRDTANRNIRYADGLTQIIAQQTPSANATVKRMVKIAFNTLSPER